MTFVAPGSDLRTLRSRSRICVLSFASAIVVLTGLGTIAGAHSKWTAVFWSADIAPILQKRCVACHTAGGFGPMPLDSYDDARKWAKEIRAEVLSRRMPPWSAATGFGDFSNDRSLSAVEIELITSWVDGATPMGPPGQLPTSRTTPSAPPDRVLLLPSHEAQAAVTLEVPIGEDRERWLTAWEFVPADRARVERATLSIAPDTALGTWTASDRITRFPPDTAQRLPAGAELVVALRYRKTAGSHDGLDSKPDAGKIALYFGQKPRHVLRHVALNCGAHRLPDRISVLALTPTLSSAGSTMEVVARRPNKTIEALAVIRGFQPAFAPTYWLRSPVSLPRDTVVNVRSDDSTCTADMAFVDN